MSKYNSFPTIPNAVPRRQQAYVSALFRRLFIAQGWQIQGAFPNLAKAVAIVSPHTSNFDAWYTFNALLGADIRVTIFGKHTLFKGPLKPLLSWIGVVPVMRESAQGFTQQVVQHIQQQEKIWIGLAPEGTRKSANKMRTGFYHIALAAQIPIVMFALDYAEQSIRILGVFEPTGDYEQDLNAILAHYAGQCSAKHPARTALPLQKLQK